MRRDAVNRCCYERRYQGGGGGASPLAERLDTTRWSTPEEEAEAVMAEAQAGTARGGGVGVDVKDKEMGGTGGAQSDERGRSLQHCKE